MTDRIKSSNQRLLMRTLRTACVVCFVLGMSISGSLMLRGSTQSQNQAQSNAQYSAKSYPARFLLNAGNSGTTSVGKEAKVTVVLLDQYGKPLKPDRDITITLIATTLDSAESAKKWLSESSRNQRPVTPTSNLRLSLQAAQRAARLTYVHKRTENDKDVKVTSFQKGKVLVVAESPSIAPGQTVLIVVDKKYDSMLKRSSVQSPAPYGTQVSPEGAFLMPIRWQEPNGAQLWLQIVPTEPPFYAERNLQYSEFEIALKPEPEADDEYLPAPADITVELNVKEGNATFEPNELTIKKGTARTAGRARLTCVPGGPVKFTASAVRVEGFGINKDTKELTFPPGIRSTKLKLTSHPGSALANGLDPIIITVETVQEYGNREESRTPEDEGMKGGRTVSFRIEGDARGTSFLGENGAPEITLANDSGSGSIRLLGRRSASRLKVIATSINGQRERITNSEDNIVSFSFPWLALGSALLGGLLFPLLQRKDFTSLPDKSELVKLSQGIALGGLFFTLALFGAISSNPQAVESVSVTLTKIPTEHPLGALAIGFLGSALWGGLFTLATVLKKKST